MQDARPLDERIKSYWDECGGAELLTPRDLDRFVLESLLREIEKFGRLPEWRRRLTNPEAEQMILRGVRYKPSRWTSEAITPARRVQLSRTIRRLDATGLVTRLTERGRDRVSCLQFTTGGLSLALNLADGAVNFDAVIDGLDLTDWGQLILESFDPLPPIDLADLEILPVDLPTPSSQTGHQ